MKVGLFEKCNVHNDISFFKRHSMFYLFMILDDYPLGIVGKKLKNQNLPRSLHVVKPSLHYLLIYDTWWLSTWYRGKKIQNQNLPRSLHVVKPSLHYLFIYLWYLMTIHLVSWEKKSKSKSTQVITCGKAISYGLYFIWISRMYNMTILILG
jgi:hypothetical protein